MELESISTNQSCSSHIDGDLICVLVLLSTFNGVEFVEQLIDSVKSQSQVCTHLLIRDDGSSDQTQKVVEARLDNRDFLIQGNHVGVTASYGNLLTIAAESNFDYVAWADQDDIWLKQKLATAIQAMNAGFDLYASNRIPFGNSVREYKRRFHSQPLTLVTLLAQNLSFGCTLVLKRDFLSRAIKYIMLGKPYLDYQLGIISAIENSGWFDANSLILYRRHNNNDSLFGPLKLLRLIDHYRNFNSRLDILWNLSWTSLSDYDISEFRSRRDFLLNLASQSKEIRLREPLIAHAVCRVLLWVVA